MAQRKGRGLPGYTTPTPVRAWRWILGTLVILACWLVGGSLLGLALLPYTGVDPAVLVEGGDILGGMPGWGFLFFALITFIPLFLGVLIAYRFVLGVKLRYLFSTVQEFRWWRVGLGFWVWLVLIGGPVVISLVATPDEYRFNFQPGTFIPFALVGILLLPIQTTAEELFFRGWVLQWAGQRVGNILVLSIISGVAFSVPHLLNPEAAGDVLGAFFGYFTVGFALAWVTVRDRSLEVAIGAHLSNNLFAALIVGYEGGALPADALFVSGPIEWGASNLLGVLVVPLFILLTMPGRPRAPKMTNSDALTD
jgi:uncharacterized protein